MGQKEYDRLSYELGEYVARIHSLMLKVWKI